MAAKNTPQVHSHPACRDKWPHQTTHSRYSHDPCLPMETRAQAAGECYSHCRRHSKESRFGAPSITRGETFTQAKSHATGRRSTVSSFMESIDWHTLVLYGLALVLHEWWQDMGELAKEFCLPRVTTPIHDARNLRVAVECECTLYPQIITTSFNIQAMDFVSKRGHQNKKGSS